MQPILMLSGVGILAILWLGPLPRLAPDYFSAHMTMHMGVVAAAAPLLALAIAGRRFDPTGRHPAFFSAIPASVVELLVVWSWHAPALHHLARATTAGLIAEQGMFLAAAFVVWVSALGGQGREKGNRTGAGVVALLLTSMHITLLGALIGLAPRALYAHGPGALDEQHLGGAIMLIVGGAVYLAAGLLLAARLVSDPRAPAAPRSTA